MKRNSRTYSIGSISHGTMLPSDLIPTFISELESQLKHGPSVSRDTRKRAYAAIKPVRNFDWDNLNLVNDTLETLFDVLDEFAAPHMYFGSHPGDGSDYGFWLSDGFTDDFDGLKVSDTSEIPSDYRGEVIQVSDHGNVTLYVKTARKLTEVWSIV